MVILTDSQMQEIARAWLSYDTAMGDPWRNDFSDNGQADDEMRYTRMIEGLQERMPDIPFDEIEAQINRFR